MTIITNKLLPFMKRYMKGEERNVKGKLDWRDIKSFMDVYGFQLVLLTCLSPILTIIPSVAFRLAHDSNSISGYLLSLIILVPWLLIPSLFIQHISSQSKLGKIISYVFLGLILVSYFLWIFIIKL